MTDEISAGSYEGISSRKKSLPSKLSPSSNDKKKVQCHECGFSCTSYAQLKVHNRIHTGDKPFECPECNYASTRNANLQRHIHSMHAGRYSSPATGKRGRPPHNLQGFSSSSGKSMADQHFLDSLATSRREHVKSPLSEIRARELMLAENAVCHDKGITSEMAQSVIESSLRPRLLHPASQVLALPAHIPLTQDSSSSFSSDSVIRDPIMIEDDSTDGQTGLKHSLEPEELQGKLQPQVPLDKTLVSTDDKILANPQQSPVLITSNATRTTSSSPEVIPIDDQPLPSLDHKQGPPRFACVMNDTLSATPVSHGVVAEETPISTTPAVSSAVYQEIPDTTPAGLTTTKFSQRNPLVLEIENSSIGLYLHLDLSKYLCETAQNWLSQHTQQCNEVCRANFPDHTNNTAAESVSLETDLRSTSGVLPSPPITISNKVPTISKAPSIPPNRARAFPTAILAVPQSVPSSNQTDPQSSKQLNFPIMNKSTLSSVNSSKVKRSEVNQDIPQAMPVVLNTIEHAKNGSTVHTLSERKQSTGSSLQASGPQEHNSLIFQRWPALRQYMQVRCLAGNQKEFSCYKCGKHFSQLHQLKVHVKNHIKRYNCVQCHYSTHRMANLRRHQHTHRQINELTCQVCSAVMANKRAYTMHVLFAHKKQRKKSKDFDSWRKQFNVSMAAKKSVTVDHSEEHPNVQSTASQPPDAQNVTGDAIELDQSMILEQTENSTVADLDIVQGEATATLSDQDSMKEMADQEQQLPLLNHLGDDSNQVMDTGASNDTADVRNENVVIKEEPQESHPETDLGEWNKESQMEEEQDDSEIMDSTADSSDVIENAEIKEEYEYIIDQEDTAGSANPSKDAIEIKREEPTTDAVT